MKLGVIKENPSILVTQPVCLDEIQEDEELTNYFTKEELVQFLDSLTIRYGQHTLGFWHMPESVKVRHCR